MAKNMNMFLRFGTNLELRDADHHNIPIGNVKKLVPNFFDKKNM